MEPPRLCPWRSAILPALLLLCSCLNRTTRDVEGDDGAASFSTLRIVVPLVATPAPVPEGSAEGRAESVPLEPNPSSDTSLLFEISRGVGEDDQQLTALEQIVVKDTTFAGPTTVRSELDLTLASGSVRLELLDQGDDEPQVSFAALAGLGLLQRDLYVENAIRAESTEDLLVAPLLGADLEVDATSWLRVTGRLRYFLNFTAQLVSLEAGLEFLIGSEFSIFGGWRHWMFDEERTGSDIDYELAGPVIGIGVRF